MRTELLHSDGRTDRHGKANGILSQLFYKTHLKIRGEFRNKVTYLFILQDFEKWISRLDNCLNREGDYVEK
jgi:hypothetical protein